MTKMSMLAVDLAKGSFQVCGIGPDGAAPFNQAMSRPRFLTYLAEQPACIVAMGACATSHRHEVGLVPAIYVKPFVKRQKNDKAQAIAKAAARPAMRFVAEKTAETQARASSIGLEPMAP
ncbi:MAG: hypothetical protein AAGD08_15595 [Pseudomonadota bacterium]